MGKRAAVVRAGPLKITRPDGTVEVVPAAKATEAARRTVGDMAARVSTDRNDDITNLKPRHRHTWGPWRAEAALNATRLRVCTTCGRKQRRAPAPDGGTQAPTR